MNRKFPDLESEENTSKSVVFEPGKIAEGFI
jgi:hypothetical protein